MSKKHLSYKITSDIKKIEHYVFKFSDFLGKGNFSSVYKGINGITNDIVAIKYITLSSLTCLRLVELLEQQIQILTSMNHPSIVKCFQVLKSGNNCYIVTELCDGGDLQQMLKRKGTFTQQETIPYARDIYQGMLYLAKKNIIHRDIKIANIFIAKGKAKIADFGFAQKAKKQFNDGKIGTPLCMPPEAYLENLYGNKTDVWAFGVMLYQLTHGKLHLDFCTDQKMLIKNIQIQLKHSQLKKQLSIEFKDLIIRCLDVNPCTRITFQQMKNHPFIKQITQQKNELFSMREIQNITTSKTLNVLNQKKVKPVSMRVLQPQKFARTINPNQKINDKTITKQNLKCVVLQVPKITYIQLKRPTIKIQNKQNVTFLQIAKEQTNLTKNTQNSFSTNAEDDQNNSNLHEQFKQQERIFLKVKSSKEKQHKVSLQINPIIMETIDKAINLRATFSVTSLNTEPLNHIEVKTIPTIKKLLNGFIKYNQAIGIVYYCRLVYKYIIQLKRAGIYQQGNLKLKYYSSYLINLLSELQSKIVSHHVYLTKNLQNGQTKEAKLFKILQLVRKYSEKFKINIQRERNDTLNKDITQILAIINADKTSIDTFYIPDKTNLQYLHEKMLKFTQTLERSSRFQKYNDFDSNPQLEQKRVDNKQSKQALTDRIAQNNDRMVQNYNKLPQNYITTKYLHDQMFKKYEPYRTNRVVSQRN